MLKHYLQTALSNLWRFKFTTFANVLCLAFGLSCFLLAYGVFAFFASSNRGFKNADRIYVITTQAGVGNNKSGNLPISPWVLGDYIRTEIPEVAAVSRSAGLGGSGRMQVRVAGKESADMSPLVAEENLLDLFDIPLLRGKTPGDHYNAICVAFDPLNIAAQARTQ